MLITTPTAIAAVPRPASAAWPRRAPRWPWVARALALARPPGVVLALALALTLEVVLPKAAFAQTHPSAAEAASYTGLHAAAWRGDEADLRAALGTGADASARANARDARGRTPLHLATFNRQHGAIRLLAAAGAQLGLLDDERYDAVTIAAVADDEPTLALLLQLGASARLTTSRWDGTALIAAAHLGHDGVVRQLLAAGAPVDHVNNLHWTALIEAVVLGDGGPRHQAVVRQLLAAGANRALTDSAGRTALQLAQQRGYATMVALLSAPGR